MTDHSLIRVENLYHSYNGSAPVLKGVSFEQFYGENIGLIGPNGAGKTTLLLHLNGLLRGEGRIIVDDIELRRATLDEIRRRIGFVFQNAQDQLFCPTIGENIAFSLKQNGTSTEEIESRVKRTLETVGLAGYMDIVPSQMSPGQQRRAALASVLVSETSLLVLDEPTGGLDPRGRREFIELIARRPETLLVATHDLEMVRVLCNRVLVLDDGLLVADGSCEDILDDKLLLREHGLV